MQINENPTIYDYVYKLYCFISIDYSMTLNIVINNDRLSILKYFFHHRIGINNKTKKNETNFS